MNKLSPFWVQLLKAHLLLLSDEEFGILWRELRRVLADDNRRRASYG